MMPGTAQPGGVHVKVKDLVSRKGANVATIGPDASVADVAAALTDRRIGALVVSADGASVDGIVSERDIVAALAREGSSALEASVRDLMVTDVATCAPNDTVASLMAVMTERRIRHLPVIDGGRLAGIVSIGDVVKARVDELEEDKDRLHEYIGAR